jgi:hypothetical protein
VLTTCGKTGSSVFFSTSARQKLLNMKADSLSTISSGNIPSIAELSTSRPSVGASLAISLRALFAMPRIEARISSLVP